MLNQFLPLLMLFVAMSTFVVFLITKIPRTYWFKWVAIPVMMLGSFYSYHIYDSMFGYAYPIATIERSLYLSYRIKEDSTTEEKNIELWIANLRSSTSRLYLIPWSEKSEKALKDAERRQRATGVPQIIDFKKRGGTAKDGTSGKGSNDRSKGQWDFDLESYDLPFSEIIPKESAAGAAPPPTMAPPQNTPAVP